MRPFLDPDTAHKVAMVGDADLQSEMPKRFPVHDLEKCFGGSTELTWTLEAWETQIKVGIRILIDGSGDRV